MMRTKFSTDSRTIILEGDVKSLTLGDSERVDQIVEELASKHQGEEGGITFQSSKGSGYKKLTIVWESKPKLEE